METNRERNIAKLKELGVLWQWLRNVYLQNDNGTFKDVVNKCLSQTSFKDVVEMGFIWFISKEKHIFWLKISEK